MPDAGHKGLGRVYRPDPRDRGFRMAAVVPRRSVRTSRYWNDRWWWGDQGQTPQCVAYSAMHFVADGPITHGVRRMPFEEPASFFAAIGGSDYGAYVRDAMVRLQQLGVIGAYHWAFSMAELDLALLEVGPVIIGVDWFDGMFDPDASGFIHPTGDVAGGHAIECNGINVETGTYRLKNSWGRSWGKSGRCYVKRADMEYLLFGLNGEAVLATELNA
jgi:papain like protease